MASTAGYNATRQNLLLIGKSFFAYLLATAAFGLGGYFINLAASKRLKEKSGVLASFVGLSLIAITLIFAKRYFHYPLQYKCLPLIGIVVTAVYLFKLFVFRKRQDMARDISLLALCLFSMLLIFRVILNVKAAHYGFYLLVPGMILYHIFFLKLVPDILIYKNSIINGSFVILFILLIANHFAISNFIYRQKTLKVETKTGTLFCLDTNRERRCKELIDFLEKNTHQDDKLVVLPEGVTINFLAQRENPLYYYSFLPHDLARKEVEEAIITQLRDTHTDYIAIVQRPTGEYGYPIFGIHYAKDLWRWLSNNYYLVRLFGPKPFSSQEFGIALLKHK